MKLKREITKGETNLKTVTYKIKKEIAMKNIYDIYEK